MSVHAVIVIDAATGTPVEAELDDDAGADVLLDIEDAWAMSRRSIARQMQDIGLPRNAWPESLHWNWVRKSLSLSLAAAPDDYRIFTLKSGGRWQAAMLTLTNASPAALAPDVGKALVYVEYLEAAPWNWSIAQIGQAQEFKRIGKLMMRGAIEQSLAEKRGGRVGLHSLLQAQAFYKGCGLKFVRFDAAKQNLPYFELSAQAAQAFLGR